MTTAQFERLSANIRDLDRVRANTSNVQDAILIRNVTKDLMTLREELTGLTPTSPVRVVKSGSRHSS